MREARTFGSQRAAVAAPADGQDRSPSTRLALVAAQRFLASACRAFAVECEAVRPLAWSE